VHPPTRLEFTSDNITGASPEVLAALARANEGALASYGSDPHTAALERLAESLFERRSRSCGGDRHRCERARPLGARSPVRSDLLPCRRPRDDRRVRRAGVLRRGAKLLGLPRATDACGRGSSPSRGIRPFDGVHHVQPAAVTVSQATEWERSTRPRRLRRSLRRRTASD